MPRLAQRTEAPKAVYRDRLAARADAVAREASRARRASNLRLVVFIILLGLFGACLGTQLSASVLLVPATLFALLVVLQARAAGRSERAAAAAALYEDGLARLDDAWAGRGRTGLDLAPSEHLYASDLDLFGEGSLFELFCTARTRLGERRLAEWLLAPATPERVRSRQAAVRELTPRLDLREDLAVLEGGARSALERGATSAWARAPARLAPGAMLWAHRALAATSTLLLLGWFALGWKPLPMLICMLLQFALAARQRAVVQEVLEAADRPAQDLALVAGILKRLQEEPFEDAHLCACIERLNLAGEAPSTRIRRLSRLMDLVDARRNQIFLPLSWLGSLGTQWAYALEVWRNRHGEAMGAWLDVVAEVEALGCLASYAYEHPDDAFPRIADIPVFAAEGLGHPLLPAGRNVRNDVHLGASRGVPQALLISGSNMSGKSTLLRSVGVATVLAFAGAPVRANALHVGPLAVGASIRLHDSLQEGASRFYAEIARLRQIVDLLGGPTTPLFLIDEILHGTNSRDRRLGAAAVLRTLLQGGSLGLVTTHDLALAAIAEQPGSRLANMHFEDQVQEGAIAFDYRLRPGVVTRGNALALMRMMGLEVSGGEEDVGT